MSKRGRLGIILALMGLGLVVVGGLAISYIMRRSLVPLAPPTAPPPLTETVVVTTHDIALGNVLKPEDLAQVEIPVELVPRGVIKNIEEVAGKISRIPLIAGEMVMTHHLADPTNVNHDIAYVIGDEKVLMAIPATDLMSQLNIIQRGDLVDILVSVEQPVKPQGGSILASNNATDKQDEEDILFTFNALQRVEIAAFVVDIIPTTTRQSVSLTSSGGSEEEQKAGGTPEPTPTPAPSQVKPQALLLALSPQDALVLKHLKDAGGILDIVLRAPTSTQLFELDPVLSDYLIDRYELTISR